MASAPGALGGEGGPRALACLKCPGSPCSPIPPAVLHAKTESYYLARVVGAIPVLAEVHIYVADHHKITTNHNKTVIKIKEETRSCRPSPNNNGHDVQLVSGTLVIVGDSDRVAPMLELIEKRLTDARK